MKIFVVGDHYSGTGPANVTKAYIDTLPQGTLYQKYKNKLFRLVELYLKIPICDVIFISGYSKQNLIALNIAKKSGIKTAYLVHGSIEYENEINGTIDEQMNEVERKTFEGADLLLAVSSSFARFLNEQYPEYKDKISVLTNGIDYKLLPAAKKDNKKEAKKIISIGGGMPRKRIKTICQALEILNSEGMNISLTVAGADGKDTEIIRSYPFVNYLGLVNHELMIKELNSSKLFIQNSCFETFGLAPIEALMCGCDILLSKECGALSLFEGSYSENDIICDTQDCEEIANKIRYLMMNGNNEKMLSNLDMELTSWEYRSVQLQNILKNLIEKE